MGQKKKVLITGVAGFIGSHTAELFLKEGFSVVGIDNFDPFYPKHFKENNLKELLQEKNFEFLEIDFQSEQQLNTLPNDIESVIHLGAKAGVFPSLKDPESYIQVNISGTLSVMNWMNKRGLKDLIFASSSSVYGNSAIPFHETQEVNKPISPYAFSKKSCELLTYNYHHLYQYNVVNLRFFTVYGERQRPDLAIFKFVKAMLESKPITLYGKGDTERDYTYVKDIVNGIFKSYIYIKNHKNVYEIINLGNNKPISLINMVNTISDILKITPIIEYSDSKPGDVDVTYANIDKAIALLKYSPSTSFEEGIRKFADWLVNSKQTIDDN